MRLESFGGQGIFPTGESRKINPYCEYLPGDQLSFALKTFSSNGEIETYHQSITIEDLRGGGFFGKVIIPQSEDFVIKTSLPDPWHHFWRIINWDFKPFPAQSDELSAQLEHLSTKVIHLALPALSNNKFCSPDSLGYAQLNTGFAQIVEKMHGRPPRFDRKIDEYKLFRQAQQKLLQIGYNLGLEAVGQIHPDNPFGMANLWFDENRRRFIWLDTIPAIRHTGWVKPFFYFKFHGEVKKEFSSLEPTFNQIHTERFRAELDRNKNLFDEDLYLKLALYLDYYDRVWGNRELACSVEEKQIDAAIKAFAQFAKEIIPELVKFPVRLVIDPVRLTYDEKFRTKFLLSGVEQARKYELITQEEFQEAKEAVVGSYANIPDSKYKYVVLKALLPYYFVTSQALNYLELSLGTAALFADDKLLLGAFAVFMGEVFPSIFRYFTTRLIGKLSKTDLKLAALLSAIPKYGPLLGPAGGLAATVENPVLWHATVRSIMGDLSKISPAGGIGSQFEAQLYEMIGRPIEKLAE